jgi:peptidoglycan/xylan/chitin deacetylase (PgdA/CDA1 family)
LSQIVVHGPRDRPRFALTFDDGPGPATRELLALLGRHSAKATFFLVGKQVEAHADIAREVVDAGHEVGSHSYAHLDHEALQPKEGGPEKAVADALDGARAIERALGFEPRLYRAPYGHFTVATLAEAERRGWTCVLWSADGCDWRSDADPEEVVGRITPALAPGAIVLFHDSRREKPTDRSAMLASVGAVLTQAAERRLKSCPVGALLGR